MPAPPRPEDGVVTQFHKSGKHCVEFHLVHQKRWLFMLKTAFYIVERPQSSTSAESKEVASPPFLIKLGVSWLCLQCTNAGSFEASKGATAGTPPCARWVGFLSVLSLNFMPLHP